MLYQPKAQRALIVAIGLIALLLVACGNKEAKVSSQPVFYNISDKLYQPEAQRTLIAAFGLIALLMAASGNKKVKVSSQGEFYDISDEAKVRIKEDLGSREVTTSFTCGAPPLPPCLPPPPEPPKPSIAADKKRVYIIVDSKKKTVTFQIEATFGIPD